MSGYVVYRYDSLGNLIEAFDSAGSKEGISYDPADNIAQTQVTQETPPPPPGPPSP